MKKLILIFIIVLNVLSLKAQIAGEPRKEVNPDTLYIFESPRPLIDKDKIAGNINSALGLDVLISTSGFGGGMFYHYYLNNNLLLFGELFISGVRKTDEFEQYLYDKGYWRIPLKINRLYRIPFTFGVQKFLFTESLQNSFKPYIAAGVGPALIFSTPYSKDRDPYAKSIGFFTALDKTDIYVKPNFSASFGAYISSSNTAMIGINFKYYYIPFGGEGLESILNTPIKDFGGIILSISIGKLY